MYFIIYKTTNMVNGKFYIGKHKTNTLDFDGYQGSGLILKRAIKKHGVSNFIRETLHVYHTQTDVNLKELEIVNPSFLLANHNMCYNLRVGGNGGAVVKIDEHSIPKIVSTRSDISRALMSTRMLNTGVYIYPDGTKKRLPHIHTDVTTGIVQTIKTGTSTYILNGTKVQLSTKDTRVLSGGVIHHMKGKPHPNPVFKSNHVMFTDTYGNIKYLPPDIGQQLGLSMMNAKTSVYKYSDGTTARLHITHPDVISRVAVGINTGRKFAKVECPYCGKYGGGSNMNRYHFANCKKFVS